MGLRLAGALWRFWYVRGHLSEGRRWLEGLLAEGDSTEDSVGRSAARATALRGAGVLALYQGDDARAHALLEESLAQTAGSAYDRSAALHDLAKLAHLQGNYERATALCEESLALNRRHGITWSIASALVNLGRVARAR